eukprot:2686574-Prymnesium_polylepis.1
MAGIDDPNYFDAHKNDNSRQLVEDSKPVVLLASVGGRNGRPKENSETCAESDDNAREASFLADKKHPTSAGQATQKVHGLPVVVLGLVCARRGSNLGH